MLSEAVHNVVKGNSKSDRGSSALLRSRPDSSLGERQIFLFAFVCLAVGIVLGYVIRTIDPLSPSVMAPPRASSQVTPAPRIPMRSVAAIGAPLEAELKSDPKNEALLIQLGNLYSDHRAYPKAIEYYNRALQLNPRNVNVRTDLGTAYWYAGSPQKAVAAYKKALSIDPSHIQTLFNLGVVYKDGLKDYARAIAVWEKILKFHPDSPETTRVEHMIESARGQVAVLNQP